MPEALIIDAVRTPRGIGKVGKGALADHHPQHLGATVLKALAERNGLNTSEVDDIIWGTSSQRGKQGGDLGRMAALDAGYDVRASGVTLDRYCGSGITAVNLAAAQIMSGMEDLVIGGGTEMMSYTASSAQPRNPDEGPMLMDSGNLRLRAKHPQSHQGRLRRRHRHPGRHLPRGPWTNWPTSASSAPTTPSRTATSTSRWFPVYREDGSVALDREEFPRPQTTLEGLAALKASFEPMANVPLDAKGTTSPS